MSYGRPCATFNGLRTLRNAIGEDSWKRLISNKAVLVRNGPGEGLRCWWKHKIRNPSIDWASLRTLYDDDPVNYYARSFHCLLALIGRRRAHHRESLRTPWWMVMVNRNRVFCSNVRNMHSAIEARSPREEAASSTGPSVTGSERLWCGIWAIYFITTMMTTPYAHPMVLSSLNPTTRQWQNEGGDRVIWLMRLFAGDFFLSVPLLHTRKECSEVTP